MSVKTGALRGLRISRSIFVATLLALVVFASPSVLADTASRPATWATAISGVDGMGNLFQVTPGLYRSRQPSTQALKNILAQHPLVEGSEPVRTVVSLLTSDDDGAVLGKSPAVHHEWLKFSPFHPDTQDVVKFLRIVTTPSLQPVLVHCAQGSDRTGMMVAIYRIVVQGWSKDEALKEMIDGGYGFHLFWQDLVQYVRNLDVDALKAEVAQAGPWQEAASSIAQNVPASSDPRGTAQ